MFLICEDQSLVPAEIFRCVCPDWKEANLLGTNVPIRDPEWVVLIKGCFH